MVDSAHSGGVWRRFLERADSLRAYIKRRVSDPMEAEEVFQDLGLVVLRHRAGPEDIESFGPWCYALARNVIAHHFRSKRRRANLQNRVELESLAFERSHRIDPERAASARQMLNIMASGLGLEARTLLSRRYLLGESAEEIAERSAQSPTAVRMRLMRLRSLAKRKWS